MVDNVEHCNGSGRWDNVDRWIRLVHRDQAEGEKTCGLLPDDILGGGGSGEVGGTATPWATTLPGRLFPVRRPTKEGARCAFVYGPQTVGENQRAGELEQRLLC